MWTSEAEGRLAPRMRVSESGLEPDLRKIWPVPGGDWESWLKLLVDKVLAILLSHPPNLAEAGPDSPIQEAGQRGFTTIQATLEKYRTKWVRGRAVPRRRRRRNRNPCVSMQHHSHSPTQLGAIDASSFSATAFKCLFCHHDKTVLVKLYV
jgi:hypothetical protein